MDDPHPRWRPKQVVRPIAVAIVRRDEQMLVMAVRNDDGQIKGWRPVGGEIEFGERSAETVAREFLEELGEPVTEPRLLSVIENLFEHHGAAGHEIVFVFDVAFRHAAAYLKERYDFFDGSRVEVATWVEIERFRSETEPLFPAGLVALLR